jgi:hypothetical protein
MSTVPQEPSTNLKVKLTQATFFYEISQATYVRSKVMLKLILSLKISLHGEEKKKKKSGVPTSSRWTNNTNTLTN